MINNSMMLSVGTRKKLRRRTKKRGLKKIKKNK
jgi:hypothetical protein